MTSSHSVAGTCTVRPPETRTGVHEHAGKDVRMTTTTAKAGAAFKAFEDKVTAQVQEGKARLEQLEAKEKGAQSELDAINSLKATKENIHRKVQDLKTTHEDHVARAQAAIDADVAAFKARIEELNAKLKFQSEKK